MNDKILIVDDNENILQVMQDILDTKGIESVICKSGKDALVEIEKEIYAAAIIDINLPDMNGRDILSALKKRNHFSQAYVLTGAPSMIELSDFIDLGAVDFFAKGELDLGYIVESIQFGIRRQKKWRTLFKSFSHR